MTLPSACLERCVTRGSDPGRSGDLIGSADAPSALPGALTSWVDSVYQHLVFISADGHVHGLHFWAGPWLANDLTAGTGVPQAVPTSPARSAAPGRLARPAAWQTGQTRPTGTWLCLAAGRHVHELHFAFCAGPWLASDLTAAPDALRKSCAPRCRLDQIP